MDIITLIDNPTLPKTGSTDEQLHNFIEALSTTGTHSAAASLASSLIGLVAGAITFLLVLLILEAALGPYLASHVSNLRATLMGAATSTYEVLGFATCFTATLFFYLFAAYASDEVNEVLPLAILLIVGGTLMGFLLGFLGGKASFALSPSSGGEPLKRLAPVDALAVFLCLLRILTCWFRFILYDLQVEHVDLALQYSEDIGLLEAGAVTWATLPLHALMVFADLTIYLFQAYLALFKFFIATFLLWLILDLFLLRSYASRNEDWFLRQLYLSHCRKLKWP